MKPTVYDLAGYLCLVFAVLRVDIGYVSLAWCCFIKSDIEKRAGPREESSL